MFKLWDTRPVVGVVLFPQVEVLDFAGPYEVFACSLNPKGKALFQVHTMAAVREVECRGGMRVRPDYMLNKAPGLDIIVVPGGPGAREYRRQKPVLEFLRERAGTPAHIVSACTGSYLLAAAGLLDGLEATTHSARLEEFAKAFPKVKVKKEKIIDQGRIVTAGGVSSGIDLALYLLEKYYGEEARSREAKRLDGPWS
jgi:transcriptional regulator GlxA family with amidase domain